MPDRYGPAPGYFCVSGVAHYASAPSLEHVPQELETVRQALSGLGLRELFRRADGAENTHNQLREAFLDATETGAGVEEDSTLVIYCTGHGRYDPGGREWYLVPADDGRFDPKRFLTPAELLQPLLDAPGLPALTQVLLVVDACYAEAGVTAGLGKSLEVADSVGREVDLWTVAAARRREEAGQFVFAGAFAGALLDAARPSLGTRFLDLAAVVGETRRRIERAVRTLPKAGLRTPAAQRVLIVSSAADDLRALPNPGWMAPVPAGLDPEWSAPARGVSSVAEAGWYFTGRSGSLDEVADRLAGAAGARPLLVTGSRGCGKSALLGRLLLGPAGTPPRRLLGVRAAGSGFRSGGRTVAELVRAIATRSRIDTDDPAELVRRLAASLYAVVVDQVDDTADPGELLERLLLPLSRAEVPLVIAGRPALAAQLPPYAGVLDLDEAVPSTAAEIQDYLALRLTVLTGRRVRADDTEVTRLAAAGYGCFTAAEAAVRAYAEARDRRTEGELDAARAAGARTLHQLCAEELGGALGSRQRGRLLADVLGALCVLHSRAAMPDGLWTRVAQRLGAGELTAAQVGAAAARAAPFLRRGPDGWYPAYPFRPEAGDLPPYRVVRALLDELGAPGEIDWRAVPAPVVRIVAAAVGVSVDAYRLLDDPAFLLAAGHDTVASALRTLRDKDDRARRARVWRHLPATSHARGRRFALRVLAERHGLRALAEASPPDGAPAWAAWVQPDGLGRSQAPILAMAVAGSGPATTAFTAHDDGGVRAWELGAGGSARRWRPPGFPVPLRGLSAIGTDGCIVLATVGWDGRASVWRLAPDEPATLMSEGWPGLLTEPGAPPLAALHPAGLAAFGRSTRITVRALDSGAEVFAARPGGDPLVGCALAGTVDRPALWSLDSGGRAACWVRSPDGWLERRILPAAAGGLRLAAAGDEAVLVDVRGRLWLRGFASGVRPFLGERPGALAAALSLRTLAVGGDDDDEPWLDLYDRVRGGPPERLPLDDRIVALAFVGEPGEDGAGLLVARRCGLLRLALPVAPADPPPFHDLGDSR